MRQQYIPLYCFLLLGLFLQDGTAAATNKKWTPAQERMHEERKKIQQQEIKLTPMQRRTLTQLAHQLEADAPPPLPALSYSELPQKRSGFVCSWSAPPPSILDFSSGSVWQRLPPRISGSRPEVFQDVYDIFPLLLRDGFRIAFVACSSCERVFPRDATPRHCSWPDRNTITFLQKEEPFLYSCSLPKSLWMADSVTLKLNAGGSELQIELDSLHLPASLPCHPPYRLSAATMVWAFREMFKTLQWIKYHRLLGVEHFWVYDNIRDPLRRLQKLLRYHIEAGLVTYVHDPVLSKSIGDRHFLANRHAANRFGLAWSEWLWIGDVDEYMLPPSCAQNMVDVLRHVPDDVASVSVPGPKFMFDEQRWNPWKGCHGEC